MFQAPPPDALVRKLNVIILYTCIMYNLLFDLASHRGVAIPLSLMLAAN